MTTLLPLSPGVRTDSTFQLELSECSRFVIKPAGPTHSARLRSDRSRNYHGHLMVLFVEEPAGTVVLSLVRLLTSRYPTTIGKPS